MRSRPTALQKARPVGSRSAGRTGFTLLELLVVILLMGIILALSYPRLSKMASRGALRTARGSLMSAINVAKSAAVASGTCGFLRLTESEVTVFTVACEGSGGQITVVSNRNFHTDYGVTLTMEKGSAGKLTVDSLGFDPRGIPIDNTQSVLFTIIKGAETKTVSVQKYGRVQ